MSSDEGLLAGEMVLLTAMVTWLSVSNALFYRRRKDFPINKSPVLPSYTLVYASTVLALMDIITTSSNFQVQCIFPYIFVCLGTHTFLLSFGSKLIHLSIAYEQELIKRKIANNQSIDGSSSKLVKIPFTVRVHKYLTTGHRTRWLIAGIAAFIALTFLIGFASSSPQVFEPDSTYGSDACSNLFTWLSIGGGVNVSLLVICAAFVANSLRKVEDNFCMKFEIKAILWFLAVGLVWIVVTVLSPALNTSTIVSIISNQLHPFFAVYVCFFHPWQVAQAYSKHRSSVNASGKAPNSASTHSSQHDKEKEKKDAGSSGPPTPSAPSNPGTPNSPKGKIASNMDEILAVLEHPAAFAELEEFMSKEFCVEELFFLRDAKKFQDDLPNLSASQAEERGRKLYSRYIDEKSPLSVNISGAHRNALRAMFGNPQNANSEAPAPNFQGMESAYRDAFLEVLKLLATDSYRRFKNKNKTTVTKAKMELQQTLPVLPTPAPVVKEDEIISSSSV